MLDCVQMVPPGDAPAQAAWITARLAGHPVHGVHGYFAHTPTEVAIQVARQLGVPFGFSVHAKDARKVTPGILADRARHAACVIACNVDVSSDLQQRDTPTRLVPHGVDLQRFTPQPAPFPHPLRLLAVGRLVEKKGVEVLLEACRRLVFPFQLTIIGDGPMREQLTNMINKNGLIEHVTFCGGKTHAELPAAYANAHIVVVPSIEDHTGDRDGLPNVVLEALASGRSVVASDVGAIASAIVHLDTGLLVPPRNVAALAEALNLLASRPDLRAQFRYQGRQLVEHRYDLASCTAQFCQVLEAVYG